MVQREGGGSVIVFYVMQIKSMLNESVSNDDVKTIQEV